MSSRYTVGGAGPPAAAGDDISVSAASGATPQEDLASEPPLLPPDVDVILTAEEGRNIIGGQVLAMCKSASCIAAHAS